MGITWALVLETLVKWGIPVIAAGIIAFIVKHVIDPSKRDRQAGANSRKQKEWDDRARASQVMEEKCSCEIHVMEEAIDKKFEQAQAANKAVDDEILIAVKDLQKSIAEIRTEMQEDRTDRKLTKSGILDLHLHSLIQTCKIYIERGYITPIELMQYNERMTLYHNLGGNGHMDVWDERIRALPLHEHSEQDK